MSGEEKKRPNAHYRLSYENSDNADEIVYYYNREERLAKAPQSVRDLYKQQPPRRFGILSPLVNTKAKAMTFASIVVMCVFMLVISMLGLFGGSYNLDGNRLDIQALKYEDAIIVVLKKSPPSKNLLTRLVRSDFVYTGAVEIAVQPSVKTGVPPGSDNIFYHKIFFTHEPTEDFRFTVPFDANELAIVLKTEKQTLGLTVKTE